MKKKFFAFILVAILLVTSGCGQVNKAAAQPQAIAKLAIEEFLAFTKIPRPSYSTAKALEYLEDFADQHNLAHFRDDYGSFWMDIPATKGYEDYPKLILQAHMDMVGASETGVDIDFKTTAVTAIVNEKDNTITAYGTSLGADDGAGVGIILAIAKSDFPHGPLRAIITTDEEVGLCGAEQLDNSAVDSDYIINIDYETAGDIVYSSAGMLRQSISKQYQMNDSNSALKCYKLVIDGLKGGHSGIEIDKNRLNAVCALSEIANKFSLEGIDFCIAEINAGEAFNAIARYAELSFATDASLEELEQITDKLVNDLKQDFPEEDIKCSIDYASEEDDVFLSADDSKEVIKVLSSLPQGVISMSDTTEGLVQTSTNIGIVSLEDGLINISLSARSCVTADLKAISLDYSALATENGYSVDLTNMYPGWDGNPNAPLLLLAEKAYDSIGIDSNPCAIHAGLECSWFTDKRDGVQIICIGPTIENAHTPNETLKIDTVQSTVKAILYCIEHINEI